VDNQVQIINWDFTGQGAVVGTNCVELDELWFVLVGDVEVEAFIPTVDP